MSKKWRLWGKIPKKLNGQLQYFFDLPMQKVFCDLHAQAEDDPPLTTWLQYPLKRKAKQCTSDEKHPLFKSFELLPSGCRYRLPLAKKSLYKKSFVPSAVLPLNNPKLKWIEIKL